MYKLFLITLFFCCINGRAVVAQKTPKIFAVVIGISGYQDKALPLLKYADKDAGLFAGYLQSKAGGNLPDSQLKILINEDATIAAVYDALDWLKKSCRADDVAYLYFSGHGDVETNAAGASGYLLAYNTPPNNYANNAISIKDLNQEANVLSTQNKAKVVLITDACHSGKLAGDFFKGKQLASAQLKLVLNNEVRLAACAVDEEAAEGPDWGGGRGVFSYYLLNGLSGMADGENDGLVKLQEIKSYLDSSFTTDKFLRAEQRKQHPVADGNPGFPIAVVDKLTLSHLKEQAKQVQPLLPPGLAAFKKAEPELIDDFFKGAVNQPLESFTDFKSCMLLPKDQVPQTVLMACLEYQQSREKKQDSLRSKRFRFSIDDLMSTDSLRLLIKQVNKGGNIIQQFNEKLVQLVHARGQQMVNAYLTGDIAELEKRQYYSSGNGQYRRFLSMLDVALKLVPADHSLTRLLTVHKAYIGGLVDRLEMSTATDRQADSLLKTAFIHQMRAIQSEPYAAYIQNEIGNLFLRQKKFDSAAYHFKLATRLAPVWAIPWSNIMRLNLVQNKIETATEAFYKADSLQPNLAYVMMNAGLVMEEKKDWLQAEHFYRKAITQNNVHFFPHERLGYVYLHTGRYALADSFFYEASTRKADFAVNEKYFKMGVELGGNPIADLGFGPDNLNLIELPPDRSLHPFVNMANGLTLLQYPLMHLGHGFRPPHEDSGLALLNLAIHQVPGLPLVQHYIGRSLWGRKADWRITEQALKNAIRGYGSEDGLKNQQALLMFKISKFRDSNLLQMILQYKYDWLEDYYLLGRLYEEHQFFDEAIEQYNIIIAEESRRLIAQANYEGFPKNGYLTRTSKPSNENEIKYMDTLMYQFDAPLMQAGFIKAARLYERQEYWLQAEKALINQMNITRLAGNTRQTAIDEKKSGSWNLQTANPINVYWLEANRQVECLLYSFYVRMINLFPREGEWKEKAGMFLHERLAMAFEQLPLAERKLFYESMPRYAYPWLGSIEPPNGRGIDLLIPGTGEPVYIGTPRYDPLKNSLEWLEQSITLSGAEKAADNVLEAIADLHAWMGNADEAINLYKTLVLQEPANITLRNKAIEFMAANNAVPDAYVQMDSLYQHNQLRIQQMPTLAQYQVLSSKFNEAVNLIKEYKKANGTDTASIAPLQVVMFLLAGKPAKALAFLKDSMPYLIPDDLDERKYYSSSLETFELYSTARAWALSKKTDKALAALQAALNAGFNYKDLLDKDTVWDFVRRSKKWKALLAEYSFPFLYTVNEEPEVRYSMDCRIPKLKR